MAKKSDEIRIIQERYKLEEQIRKSIEDSTKSFESFSEAQKEIVERYKLIQQTQKQINDLKKLGTAEAIEEAKILEDQVKSMVQINKELGKTSVLLKTQLKSGLKSLDLGLTSLLTKWFDFDEALRKTTSEMGIGINRINMMQKNISMAAVGAAEWGVSTEQLVQAQSAYSSELGRSVILSQSALENMSSLGKATGLGVEGVAELSAQMEIFGLGAQQSVDMIWQMSREAEAMGINSGKVIKKFQQNLGLLNRLNFKAGVKGLQEMAKFSEKYKLDMNAVASVADKVFRPEGAIEAAAQLQVLGGSLSQLGDPFQLMYKARNSPEELAKSLTQASIASATFNKKTGEFEVSAYELDRLREAAQALGMDYQELVQTAKQGAKVSLFESLLKGKGMKPEEMEMISGMAQMIDGKAQVQVGFDKTGRAQFVELENLTDTQIKQITEQRKTQEQTAKDATSIREQWTNVLNQLIVATYPLLQALQEWLKPSVDGMSSTISEWIKGMVSFIQEWKGTFMVIGGIMLALKGLKTVFGPLIDMYGWFLRGKMLGRGFDAQQMTSPLGKQGGKTSVSGGAKDFLKSQRGGSTPQTTAAPTTTPAPGQQGPGGITKGINMTDMIKGAAAILILSAALFVFAKSLQEFDKLQNGWETLGMAAVGLLTLTGALFLVSKIPTEGVLKGALAIVALGVAMIPLAYAMSLMQGVDWAVLAVATGAIIGFAFAGMFLGEMLAGPQFLFFLVGLGALILAAGALSIAMWLLSYGLEAVAPPMEMFMNSISALPQLILPLMMLGPALGMAALGIFALSASLLALGMAWWFGGGAFTEMTETIGTALQGIDPSGLNASIEAINSVDMEKLNALKELSLWMSLLGSTTTIKFDESLSIDGSIEISGEGGGKTNTDWIKDPIFVSKLKELIATQTQKDLNGGKA